MSSARDNLKTPWWLNAVSYEVYVDKFAGNFSGLRERLPYLETLGINCVWLLPHYPSPFVDDGYDVSDYCNVRSELGTLSDFDSFIREAHAKDIKVIVDLILNHTSTQHPWFLEASSSADNSKRNYYIWSPDGKQFASAVNPLNHIKPSNWIYNTATGDYYFASFYQEQADLNWANPAVFEEVTGIMDFWLAHGVDGFRLDAVPFLWKQEDTTSTNLPEVHGIIRGLRRHLESRNPDAVLLAEANGSIRQIAEYFGKGDECHLAFNFPILSKLYFSLFNHDPATVRIFSNSLPITPTGCQWVNFLTNHDDISLRFVDPHLRESLLHFLDPRGEFTFKENLTVATRLCNIFSGNEKELMRAFDLLFILPGAVSIYYGEEIGLSNIRLPENEKDLRRAVRGYFDWNMANEQLNRKDSLFWHVAGKIKKHRLSGAE